MLSPRVFFFPPLHGRRRLAPGVFVTNRTKLNISKAFISLLSKFGLMERGGVTKVSEVAVNFRWMLGGGY